MTSNAQAKQSVTSRIRQTISDVIGKSQVPQVVYGVVTAIDPTGQFLTVQQAGSTTQTPNLKFLGSYLNPTVGDTVVCANVGGDLWVLGSFHQTRDYPLFNWIPGGTWGPLANASSGVIDLFYFTVNRPCRVRMLFTMVWAIPVNDNQALTLENYIDGNPTDQGAYGPDMEISSTIAAPYAQSTVISTKEIVTPGSHLASEYMAVGGGGTNITLGYTYAEVQVIDYL